MPVSFAEADADTYAVVTAALRRWHPRLRDAGVTVGVIVAASDKKGEPSILRKGTAIAATMQVVSLKDRVLKKVDAQMVVALEVWEKLEPEEREALCDHELCHIDLKEWQYHKVLDAYGRATEEEELKFERDDLGRPKLKSVPGDVDLGDAFSAVIRRHGRAALEYQHYTKGHRWAERAYLGLPSGDEDRDGPRELNDDEREADVTANPFADAEVTSETGEVVTRRVDVKKLEELKKAAIDAVAGRVLQAVDESLAEDAA